MLPWHGRGCGFKSRQVHSLKMADCIFCKIIKGEIPSTNVYEDENTVAFLDINPITSGHVLVVPREHFETVETASEEALSNAMKAAKKLMIALESFNQGTTLGLNNKTAAGQSVPHVHFHLIPRNRGDGLPPWPSKKYEKGEAEAIADKIKRLLK